MNEQLQAALTETINLAVSGTREGIEFLRGELPDAVSQLLMWELIRYGSYFVFGVLILLVAALGIIKVVNLYRRQKAAHNVWKRRDTELKANASRILYGAYDSRSYDAAKGERDAHRDFEPVDPDHPGFLFLPPCGVVLAVMLSSYFINLKWLQVLVAPKVYLIEYAASLVK